MTPVRVVHVITGLQVGGAELTLHRLVQHLRTAGYSSEVVSLAPPGPVAARIAALGVPVHSLEVTSAMAVATAVVRLVRLLRRLRPEVVQTWMYHADLVGGLAARLVGAPAVWNLRATELTPAAVAPSTRMLARLNGRASAWLPARIVCCADSARRLHVDLGYRADIMTVIPNGFEVVEVDDDLRRRARESLGLEAAELAVGRVARYSADKDYPTFVAAAAAVARARRGVRFVLCGQGVDAANLQLVTLLTRAGIRDRTLLLGHRENVLMVHAALDVAVSSSVTEGFPNVIGEAMAAGVPVVATDVGESRVLVGDAGTLVPPADPHVLAAAVENFLDLTPDVRRARGLAGRRRIREQYGLETMARRYGELYEAIRHEHVCVS